MSEYKNNLKCLLVLNITLFTFFKIKGLKIMKHEFIFKKVNQ